MIYIEILLEISLGEFSNDNSEVISCRKTGGIPGVASEENPGGISGGIRKQISGITPGGISRGLLGEISACMLGEISAEIGEIIGVTLKIPGEIPG